jgi:hypothetical protein
MSEAAIPEAAMGPRPWWFVWPVATLVPIALGLIILEGFSFVLPPRGGGPVPADLHWDIITSATPIIAAIAVPSSLLLVAIMAFAERSGFQSWGRWFAAGLVAATPVAAYVTAQGLPWLAALLYAFGLLGTGIAHVARHGGRTA